MIYHGIYHKEYHANIIYIEGKVVSTNYVGSYMHSRQNYITHLRTEKDTTQYQCLYVSDNCSLSTAAVLFSLNT